jgi:hypothetical protein
MFRSRCRNCFQVYDYYHRPNNECTIRDEFWYVGTWLRTYIPSDNLEYLEWCLNKKEN